MASFSPASRIILIERADEAKRGSPVVWSFSPASRIILIERNGGKSGKGL